MVSIEDSLRRELRNAGLTRRAIDAVWPEWWSSNGEHSLSATTELRYTVARRLGISPRSLFEGKPKFAWRDEAKFKNLGDTTPAEQSILTSFGVAVGRALIAATPAPRAVLPEDPSELRWQILKSAPYVRLDDLLAVCWGLGIPVVKTSILPLEQKRMQAMTVRLADRYAVLVGRDSRFPAWIAFVLAHELGHIARGHVAKSAALLEMADPLRASGRDDEELRADRFALELLTGQEQPAITSDNDQYSATELAAAAERAGRWERIDPGVLALCLAYSTNKWKASIGALKVMSGQELPEDVGKFVNRVAEKELAWESINLEHAGYLRRILGSDE